MIGLKWGLFCFFERDGITSAEAFERQLKIVELVDGLGFDSAWFAEHHFNDFSVCPSPTLLLANAIARTKRIRLGCAGFLAPFYDPIRLAEEIAALDNLSGGRINVGFAKGAFAPDSKAFNVAHERLRERMFEIVPAVDRLLHSASSVSYKSENVAFDEVEIEPKPLQNPMPISIATFASDETIRFAAERGYGLLLHISFDWTQTKRVIGIYESVAKKPPKIAVTRAFYIGDNQAECEAKGKAALERTARMMMKRQAYNKKPDSQNDPRFAALINERKRFFSGETFLPNSIIGTPDFCLDKVRQLGETFGEATIMLKPLALDYDDAERMIAKFNDEVIAKL
ncbi:MAG: LLM class flavin-dependent oxidoreductase [Helicobacteraceae bacterium]|jgi:alkanesulfonate monooxygenase SsuD/methylene tetrahydromethanopterin reductase-like flavin-dependent oxidoreductase (luciferase family)|nr:LLM class flavin-dependent oxidoreductase [Helicobacteraceae bacterium]